MNIASAHLDALQEFGYTEAEASFLYTVATHSGYFVARQFLGYAGAHWGKRTTLFWRKVERLKHVRIERFPKSGVIYHLFSRRLYREIERENIRNRRSHEIEFIKRRIAILDFVMLNTAHRYLETEPEKVCFFCESLGVPKDALPAKVYVGKQASPSAVRYFVDKFPMFVASPSPRVTFTYVHEGPAAFTDFSRHLEAYLPLFQQLSEFGFIYLSRSDAYFGRACEIFDSFVKNPLDSDVTADLLRYFQVSKAWDEKQYGSVSDADLIFRNQAKTRFGGERFERLYHGWKDGRMSESGIRQELQPQASHRTVQFEARLLGRVSARRTDESGGR